MDRTLTRRNGLARTLDGISAARIRATVTDGLPAGFTIRCMPGHLELREDGRFVTKRYASGRVDRLLAAAALHEEAHAYAAWCERGE